MYVFVSGTDGRVPLIIHFAIGGFLTDKKLSSALPMRLNGLNARRRIDGLYEQVQITLRDGGYILMVFVEGDSEAAQIVRSLRAIT